MLHPIGAGALGPVFRVYEPGRDRFVALKLFRLDLPPERVHRLLAELEALIAADRKFPVVATPLAAGIVEASAYLAQDFVAGDSLDVFVRERGPMSPPDAVRVATGLAAALDHVAARNVVHGGLHPRDVLMTAEGPCMTGVGVVQALERVSIAAPSRRPYVAPERATGGGWDRRADIFSLAAIMFELLWGRRVTGTGDQASSGVKPLASADLMALQRTFGRALAGDPDDRFDTAGAFAEALSAAFGATKPAPSARSSRPQVEAAKWSGPGASAARSGSGGRRARGETEPKPLLDDVPILAASVESSALAADRALGNLRPVNELDLFEAPAPIPDVVHRVNDPKGAADPVQPSSALPTPSDAFPAVTQPPEHMRSTVWPLALALVLGLSVGFAGGYGVGSHEGSDDRNRSSGPTAPASTDPSVSGSRDPVPGSDAGSRQTERGVGSPRQDVGPGTAPTELPAARQSDATPLAGPAAIGRVLVRSEPSGAHAWLDGRDAGVTPLTLRALAPGSHTIRVSLEGYVPAERRVVVGPKRPAQSIAIQLLAARGQPRERGRLPAAAALATAAQSVGALQIDSRPEGANVFVDGKSVGKTPIMLEPLESGDHDIRLELEGYRHWISSVRIGAGGRGRVAASLEP